MDARLATVLADCELEFVRTLAQATRALQEGEFGLLLIGVRFDDSRMFDLLRQVRSDERHRGLPVVCVREPGLGFTAISTRTLEVTCRALDADTFVDLTRFGDDEARNAALRQAIEALPAFRKPG